MSKEYIEREIVLAITESFLIANKDKLGYPPNKAPIYHMLKTLSAADVEPVRHGEWREEFRSQKSPDGYFYWNTPQKKIYVCSICGREEVKREPYCNCGAKMNGGSK